MSRKIRTISKAEEVRPGTIARGVNVNGQSFYTLELTEDGFWAQMACDDEWEHSSLFPFFDHLELIWEPK